VSDPPTSRATLLTAPGTAAIAVIRIAGPGVGTFLARHFARTPKPLRCVHGDLRDGEDVIDDIVVVLHEDGQTADLNLHGGPWVVASAVELLKRADFKFPIETGSDALNLQDLSPYDGDSMLDREVQAYLPLAKTEEGVRMLLGQPQAWADLRESRPAAALLRLALEAILNDRCLSHMLFPPRVAITGAPNVGKSTLANRLFAQDRSITADMPGTTRDWVGELANIDGVPVILIDTPGLRDSDDPIEQAAIRRSRTQVSVSSLCISVSAVSDESGQGITHDPSGPLGNIPVIRVLNKQDLLDASGTDVGLYAQRVTATTGAGMDELRTSIRRHLGCEDLDPARPRIWTPRQREIIRRAVADPTVLTQLWAAPFD
jgi:tRNA modification GTPase